MARLAHGHLRRFENSKYPIDDMVQDFVICAYQAYVRRRDDPTLTRHQMMQEAYWRLIDQTRNRLGRTGKKKRILFAASLDGRRNTESIQQDRLTCMADESPSVEEAATAREHTQYILRCMPARLRLVLLLRHINDAQLADIGAELNISESMACNLLRDANERARCASQAYEGGDSMQTAEDEITKRLHGLPKDRQYKLLLHISHRLLHADQLSPAKMRALKSLENKLTCSL